MPLHRLAYVLCYCAVATTGVLNATASLVWAEPSSEPPKPPNVLLIVSDDLTTCLGCYGNPVCRTPNIDRLASQGVRFTRAYCQFPLCGPSRASLMSGLYPHRTGVLENISKLGSYRAVTPGLAGHPSLGGFLRRNGYFSARVSKIFHMGIPGDLERGGAGGDDPDSWDFATNVMAPETASPGRLELLSPKRTHWGSNFARLELADEHAATQADGLATQQAIAIMENRAAARTDSRFEKPEQPFFLAVGLVRPHVPLIAPQRHYAPYPDDAIQAPSVADDDLADTPIPARAMDNSSRYGMNDQQQQKTLAGYYACVSFMDEQVGRLLDALDRLQLRERTIVIFTSDHGYLLGEHGCWQKLSLFEESVRVPLIVSSPALNRSRGQACSALVELVDLYPTVADLTGLAAQAPSILQGRSLRP
ncbi:MAG: sulfatase, partial [Planctomycetales bacterium]|nr:sulfatase [Planctomycetales bacterium]